MENYPVDYYSFNGTDSELLPPVGGMSANLKDNGLTENETYYEDDQLPIYPFNLDMMDVILPGVAMMTMSAIYIFITCAIVLDRQRYKQPFLMTLLNFVVSHALYCFVRYFGDVHIFAFGERRTPICHTALFLSSIFKDGSQMAIFPIYVDIIIQNMMPERHEKRKYRVFMVFLISVIWLVVILKETIFRSLADIDFYCLERKSFGVEVTDVVCHILRIIAAIAAVGVLVFFVLTKRLLSPILESVLAPILIGTILCSLHLLATVYEIHRLAGGRQMSKVFKADIYLHLFQPIIFALIWLLHNDVRASIKKLVTCTPCRKGGPEPTEHELRSDIA